MVDAISNDTIAILIDTGTTLPVSIADLITRTKGLDDIHDDVNLQFTDLANIEAKIDIIDGNVDDIELVLATVNVKIDTIDTNVDTGLVNDLTIEGKIDTVDTVVDLILVDTGLIKAKTDNLPEAIKKNTAVTKFPFGLVQSTDNISPATGITVTAKRSIDGGAFVLMTNTFTELSDGDYFIDLSAADTNGTFITYKFSGPGARTKKVRFKTAT